MEKARRAQEHLVRTSELDAKREMAIRHPLNPNSELYMTRLSDPTGLTHLGISIARVPPGKESFAMHSHSRQEEWVYILSGQGEVRIGDEVLSVGPGDFVGFPPGGPAHLVRNNSDADLVYLQGGDRREGDIGRFPELGLIAFQQGPEHMALVPEDKVVLRPFSDWNAED